MCPSHVMLICLNEQCFSVNLPPSQSEKMQSSGGGKSSPIMPHLLVYPESSIHSECNAKYHQNIKIYKCLLLWQTLEIYHIYL